MELLGIGCVHFCWQDAFPVINPTVLRHCTTSPVLEVDLVMDRNVCSVCMCIWYCAADVKACPRCGALIVKMDDGSCNHMTCTVCAAEFCWLCMQEISDIHYLRHDSQNLLTYYFTPGRTAEYCNDCVCLSVCVAEFCWLCMQKSPTFITSGTRLSELTYLLLLPQ